MKALRAGMVKKQMEELAAQDEMLYADDNSNVLPPTSMACSSCYSPYDLEDHTPYQLSCDHSGIDNHMNSNSYSL